MSENIVSEAPGAVHELPVTIVRSSTRPVKEVWNVLMTPEGSAALLGPSAVIGSKGQGWRSDEGRSGVIRSFHPLEKIRFSIRSNDESPWCMAELEFVPAEDGSDLSITFTGLPADKDLDDFTTRWGSYLDRVLAIAEA